MIRLCAALMVAAAALPFSLQAEAASTRPSLVVSGAESASADLHILTPIRVAFSSSSPSLSVSPRPSFIGLVISHRGHVVFGYYRDRVLSRPVAFGEDNPLLSRGTYTVTLLTDRAAKISIPVVGATRTIRVSVRQLVRSTHDVVDVQAVPGEPLIFGSATTTIAMDTMTIVALGAEATASNASYGAVCLSSAAAPCGVGSALQANSVAVTAPSTGDSTSERVLFVYPRELAPGKYYAAGELATAGISNAAKLVVTTVDLARSPR